MNKRREADKRHQNDAQYHDAQLKLILLIDRKARTVDLHRN